MTCVECENPALFVKYNADGGAVCFDCWHRKYD